MREYRFWQLYSDATPYATPTLVKLNVESYKEAVVQLCRQFNMRVLDVSEDVVWLEDKHGATIQYSVAGG